MTAKNVNASPTESPESAGSTATAAGSGVVREESSKARLPDQLLATFWGRMVALFGHTWTVQYGESATGAVADTWAAALAGLTGEQLGHGLSKVLQHGGEWPPSAPLFRRWCLSIPSFPEVRRELTGKGKQRSAFGRQVWLYVDSFRLSRAVQRDADRLMREAYDLAVAHVMAGGALPPESSAEIEDQPPEHHPASPETAQRELSKIAEVLGMSA